MQNGPVVVGLLSGAKMLGYDIIDPKDYLENGALFGDQFYNKMEKIDWDKYRGKRILIRGCASSIIPPWVYMYFVGKLAHKARLVYYGSEEDKIVVL